MSSNWSQHASEKGALVITRKPGDKVLINHGELTIEIIQVRGKAVRLAFYASKEISIVREEAVKTHEK